MRRILLPTDFSERAFNAARYVFKLFAGEEKTIYFLHVIEHTDQEAFQMGKENKIQESIVNLDGIIEDLKKEDSAINFVLHPIVKFGDLHRNIEEIVPKENIDLIAIGSAGTQPGEFYRKSTIGSEIVSKMACPVLVIPEDVRPKNIDNIVIATDLKKFNNETLLDPIKEISKKFNSNIKLVHIVEPGEKMMDIEDFEAKSLAHDLKDSKVNLKLVEDKNVIHGIKEYIEIAEPTLLATIGRKNNFFDEIFHKSVTQKVISNSKVPILVMHDLQHD